MKKQVNIEEVQYYDDYDYQPDNVTKKKRKTTFSHRIGIKVIAFILVVIMVVVAGASIAGLALMVDSGMYTSTREQALRNNLYNIATEDVYRVINYLENEMPNPAQNYCVENSYIASMKFTKQYSNETVWEYKNKDATGEVYTYNLTVDCSYLNPYDVIMNVEVSVLQKPDVNSPFGMAIKFINIAYSIRYWIILVALASILSIILLVVFLLCSAGHKKGYKKVQPGWGTSTPLDLLTLGMICVDAIMFAIIESLYASDLLMIVFATVAIVIGLALLLGWLMSVAVRVKLGKWWENTIVFKALLFIWKIIKLILKALKKAIKFILSNVSDIPLIWKTIVALAVVSMAMLFMLICGMSGSAFAIVVYVQFTAILWIVVICISVMLKRLQQAGEALAKGDLTNKVDTVMMISDFKKHGEALNSIAEGMNLAVEHRMKSERMKTELITNVSHDIKTPLTSIINYTDLISKEPCDNEKITEYSQVLLRQSERLKRLIEDLVEASKASTGNIEVSLAPCDLKIFLSQVSGEYEEKLKDKNLQLITTYCDSEIMVMADGRRLWRVFDNLMNNVCKYAQSNTRVYLSLERQGSKAVITLKNMSSLPLNISADELMERFVRGDSSRNTEGNGLGLSIARSLTQLQKGNLTLSIDGDLFKVIVDFPII